MNIEEFLPLQEEIALRKSQYKDARRLVIWVFVAFFGIAAILCFVEKWTPKEMPTITDYRFEI